MDLAERLGGTIINADSMQVYRELRVLTARPTPRTRPACRTAAVRSPAGRERPGASPGGAARRCGDGGMRARPGRVPILCGGTGLYFASLTKDLADIPDPGAAARAEARALLAELGPAALHARLAAVDPATAGRLRPTDSQRVARAWEVWRGTGERPRRVAGARTLAAPAGRSPPSCSIRRARSCGRRSRRASTAMLREGALEEVRALLALGLDPALPAMRAHGVPGTVRPSARRDHARGGSAAGRRWSPASTPSARRPGSGITPWPIRHGIAYDPCAMHGSARNFRKAIAGEYRCVLFNECG